LISLARSNTLNEKRAPKEKKEGGVPQPQQKGGDNKQQQQQQKGGQQQQKGGDKPPQQPKVAEKPATSEADDLEAAAEAEKKKKPKSALELLPASPMIFDAVKKDLFSARPINPNFFNTFWGQFDAAGYCLYEALYKYNNENEVYFKTSNAMGGFLQRSDAVRKYALGSFVLMGKDEDTGPYELASVWVFRGSEIPREMLDENPDSEYYDWKKLDASNSADRQKFENYFKADTLQNKTVLERRFFK